MKNPVTRIVRSVVEWFGPARRVQPEPRITPEHLREALSEMLADPETRKLLLRSLVGTALPIAGGACNTPAGDVAPGQFGSGCAPDNYDFRANVGIGISSPQTRLHVFDSSSAIIAADAPAAGANSQFRLLKGGSLKWAMLSPNDSNDLRFFNTTDRVTLQAGGNVGIGTTNPLTKLHVFDSSSAIIAADAPAAGNSQFRLLKGGSLKWAILSPNNSNDLTFFDTTDRVTLQAGGNVGIGTTTPPARLSIDQRFSTTPPCTPPCAYPVTQIYVEGGIGNNSDFWGEMGMYLTVRDHANVTASNKGVLYGLNIDMYPRVPRGMPPADDVAALVLANNGAKVAPFAKATDCIFVGDGGRLQDAGLQEWVNVIEIEADADNGIRFVTPGAPRPANTPSLTHAIKMDELILRPVGPGIPGTAILLGNNMPIASLRAAAGTPAERQVSILVLDSRDVLVHRAGESATAAHEFLLKDGTELGVFRSAIADTETSLLIRRNVGGTFSLERVSVGPPDGDGFRNLRVH